MKGRNLAMSELICTVCGNKQAVPRTTGKQRNKGHMKKFWCPFCKEEINHIEIRNKDWNGRTFADVYEETFSEHAEC